MKIHIITQTILALIMLYFGVLAEYQGMIFTLWIVIALFVAVIVYSINEDRKM